MRLHVDGTPVTIRGYCALYGVPSLPLEDGLREIVVPGAFNTALRLQQEGRYSSPHLRLNHEGVGGIVCINVRTWANARGVAFQTAPLRPTAAAIAVAHGIRAGSLRGVSWDAVIAKDHEETIKGERFHVVDEVQFLAHIAATGRPAYPEAACWLNTERPETLPYHLPELARAWAVNQS